MNLAPASIRSAEPDPQTLSLSAIYLKEKLEYAIESFEGSSAFNRKIALRIHRMTITAGIIAVVYMLLNLVFHHSKSIEIIQMVACAASLLTVALVLWVWLRDYRSSWLVHTYAAQRMKRIEKKLIAIVSNSGLSREDLEDLYGEYRSVYEDTDGLLHAS